MSSNYDFDGKCGIVSLETMFDGTRLRCQYEVGHKGKHSWEKYRLGGWVRALGGIFREVRNRDHRIR